MLNHGEDGEDEVRPAPGDAPAAPPPAAPDGPAGAPSRRERVPDTVIMMGGLLCAGIGLAVMVAWFVRGTAFLRFGSQNPIPFNTALALAVTGVALVALARRRPGAALAAGVFDVVLGAAVLAEYALGRSLGIDQLVVKAYISGPGQLPGRPAINTAVCLVTAGAGLLAWGPWRPRRRPAVLAASGSVIGAIAVLAAFGYATGNAAAYGWWHFTSMAVLTTASMLILALTLLTAAWQDSRARHAGLPRWFPMPIGALALGLALWLAIAGRAVAAGRISQSTFTSAATIIGFCLAGFAALVAAAAAARRSESEKTAREGARRLFQFLEGIPVAVFIASAGGEPYFENREAERLLGRGVVPGIGIRELAETYNVFLAGTDQPYPAEKLATARSLRGQSSHFDDMEIHGPDGSVIPLETWGRPVYGAGGEVDYAITAFADISERRAREKIITRQAALLELAHDAILVRDPDGRITYWNAGAERAYGFTRAEAIGQISHEILCTQFPEPLADMEASTIQLGRWDGELTQRCADGRSIIMESRWAAQRGPGGSMLGFMEINRDITARKDAEREALRRAGQIQALNATLELRVQQRTVHLERANKNMAAFTYTAAHDLRTPLRGISGFAEALAEEYGDRLDETGRRYAGRIQAASGHMADVLDDVLQLALVSSAEISLRDVDLSAEVTTICDQLQIRDPGRRVRVAVEDGVRVTADRALIRTVLENLLENAWKFTAGRKHASIEFATTPVGDAPICCYVRDNGVGFDPVYRDKLFTPFQRLHAATEFPGTGIGLAVVRRIIDRHGGRTWAEGAIDRGATIYFTLDAEDTVRGAGLITRTVITGKGELGCSGPYCQKILLQPGQVVGPCLLRSGHPFPRRRSAGRRAVSPRPAGWRPPW
jgi:PAS domain S-box-containing protein